MHPPFPLAPSPATLYRAFAHMPLSALTVSRVHADTLPDADLKPSLASPLLSAGRPAGLAFIGGHHDDDDGELRFTRARAVTHDGADTVPAGQATVHQVRARRRSCRSTANNRHGLLARRPYVQKLQRASERTEPPPTHPATNEHETCTARTADVEYYRTHACLATGFSGCSGLPVPGERELEADADSSRHRQRGSPSPRLFADTRGTHTH